MTAPWEQVAAEGTDPGLLRQVVALTSDAGGRAAVAAAFVDGLLDRDVALATLPAPSPGQRRRGDVTAGRWRDRGVLATLRGDPTWPPRLERVAAPSWLTWRGPARLPGGPAVAIVGARRATPYGTGVAAWLAEAAAQAGATVVSGGARGIDAAAHEAAVDHATTVVLGCGHDVEYPRPHARRGGLFSRVLAGGGALVSELQPHEQPKPHNVRARNRIVAGLVDVVVVVEGAAGSGSLITATESADAGVTVMAVPGDVCAAGSAAPHQLLSEGATPCTGPDDLLAALSTSITVDDADDQPPRRDLSVLSEPVATVLAEAWPRPLRATQLAERAEVGIGVVLAGVTRGRVAGVVTESAEGIRLTRQPQTGQGGSQD